ncbi:hypothetical protein ACQPYA_16375 [Micromonospora sp. CA-263727]|uniref:hypothetical protein n=1 Tax=Micromonospora sp. CA-263727 TaxID=3239967 RepID=UPI003D8E1B4C
MRRAWRVVALATVLLVAGCTGGGDRTPARTPPTGSAAPPVSSAPPAAGTGNPFGAHWDWSRYDQFRPYLRQLGGSATYHELSWCHVERVAGRPDWSPVDRIARRTRDLGITLNLKIRIGTCWATGGTAAHTRGAVGKTESRMPLDLAAYQTFVRSVVTRYAPYGVRQYAIENEVNAPQYWAGSPEEYARLVRAAATAVHEADPAARVVDSGISSVAYGFGIVDRLLREGRADDAVAAYRAYFQRRIGTRGQKIPAVGDATRLRAALANAANVRNVAFLAATEGLIAEGVVQLRQVHFYEHVDGVPALLDYLRARTPAGVPVEAWEVGQFWRDGDGDPAGRAAEMVKVVCQLVAGGVRQVMWLPLAYHPDNRAGGEVRYGLLDPDGTERDAGRMMAALVAAARGATVTAVAVGGLTGVAFARPGETDLVLWSTSGAEVAVTGGPELRGGPVGATPHAAGQVRVGATPVLLRSGQPLDDVLAALR